MKVPVVGKFALAACIGLAAVSTLLAQRPGGAAWPSSTALLNVGAITVDSARLKQAIEKLKQEFEAKSGEFKQESERGNQMTEKLRTMKPEDPQFRPLELEIAKLRADFELHGKRVTEDMRDREAKVYYAYACDLRDEVARFAQANRLQLVLRYDVSPPDLNDPRAVLREIHKLVVYQRSLEITPTVSEIMNRGGVANTANQRPAAPAATRPVQR